MRATRGQSETVSRRPAHRRRWTNGGEHSRRRRRADAASSEVRQQEGDVGGDSRAGHRAGRGGLHPRRGAADDDRGRAGWIRQASRSREDLPARRQDSEARRSVHQQGLRRDAEGAREGRRARPSIADRSRAASRKTWRPTAASSPRRTWRSTGRWNARRWRAGIAATWSTRRRRRCPPACRWSRRCRSSTATRRSPAPPTRPTPISCITRSRHGACATAERRSRIPSDGRSISATICSPGTRSSDSS